MVNDTENKKKPAYLLWSLVLLVFLLLAALIGAERQRTAQTTPRIGDVGETTLIESNATVVEFTLRTVIGGTPAMAYVGVGGDIDGVVNPELHVQPGDTVRITLVNGDPTLHDLNIDEFNVHTAQLVEDEQTEIVEFVAAAAGTYEYYCSIPGHREIGMKGKLIVGDGVAAAGMQMAGMDMTGSGMAGMGTATVEQAVVAPAAADAVSIVRSPTDLPAPIGDRGPETVQIDLETLELNGILGDGTTYRYMTFGGQVPGPMLRVRVDDTVELMLHNKEGNQMAHSIDLHAVTGPGGGAVYTQVMPGETKSFTFKALQPGLYVYHCATASVPHHITSGMYGLILVEPEGGLPPVDREFYVMQGEMYTVQPFGTAGHLDFDYQAMLDEQPEYYVFNGSAGALTTDENALRANTGETVRIFFGVGGPNGMSSFHVIGEIFDRVYNLASLTSAPLTDVQTVVVPPGGAGMVEFKLDVPGRYILVDHALSRMERGLAGYLYAEGEPNPSVFFSDETADSSGH